MKRRGFLKLLGLLPFAPALAEAAAEAINKPVYTGFDLANGSDQISMWLVNWHPNNFRQAGKSMTMTEVARYHHYNSLPIAEALSQKNHLLQDKVWQEKNIQLGHKVNWGSKWR